MSSNDPSAAMDEELQQLQKKQKRRIRRQRELARDYSLVQQQQHHLENLRLQHQQTYGAGEVTLPYQPGACTRRFMEYLHDQSCRPRDNKLDFWEAFVSKYFTPNTRKRWCFSQHGSHHMGVFKQVGQCSICGAKPSYYFELMAEGLPRLFQVNYDSGVVEDYLKLPTGPPLEYKLPSGLILLDCRKVVEESVYENWRVVREGQLRVVFNPDLLKIVQWNMCSRSQQMLIPNGCIAPQVVSDSANAFQAWSESAPLLDLPDLSDLGYGKRYVRHQQMHEVANMMKDLMDGATSGLGPIASLAAFFHSNAADKQEGHQQNAIDLT